MGIKDFSKIFSAVKTVKIKDLAGQTIAIDAMTEIYRSALGAKTVSTLTDKYGKPTLHISVILANVIEMQRQGVNQIWVFDHDQDADANAEFHNVAKIEELAKRKKRRDEAQEKLEDLENKTAVHTTGTTVTTSATTTSTILVQIAPIVPIDPIAPIDIQEELMDDLDANLVLVDDEPSKSTDDQKAQLEKQIFSASKEMINDIKLIFNWLSIRYIEAPAGYEGEQIASYLSATDQCDAVYSGDTDPIPFGAKVHYRKNTRDKKIYLYTREDVLNQLKEANDNYPTPTIKDLRKLCAAAGSDFAPKTPRIGPKTILQKLHTIKLTKQQQTAVKTFEQEPTEDIVVCNMDKKPFSADPAPLIDWLVNERSFTRSRVVTQLGKLTIKDDKTIKQPSAKVNKQPVPKVNKQPVPKVNKQPVTKAKKKSATVNN